LKNALGTVDGLRCYDYEVANPAFPSAVVRMPDSIDTSIVFGDGANYVIRVTLFISYGDDRGADVQLEDFLAESGSGSIVAAILGDQTLGGSCMSSDLNPVTNFGYATVAGAVVMTCDIPVEVYT
jgi:hypothetical protein